MPNNSPPPRPAATMSLFILFIHTLGAIFFSPIISIHFYSTSILPPDVLHFYFERHRVAKTDNDSKENLILCYIFHVFRVPNYALHLSHRAMPVKQRNTINDSVHE